MIRHWLYGARRMTELRFWEIDRLAASRLLVRLEIEATPTIVEEVAIEFAQHRQDVERWVAERVQSQIVSKLEERSKRDFARMDESWNSGFSAAEELIATLMTNELLDQPYGKAPSKGQMLRSMVKEARKRSAIVERRSS